jgi:hypothetical protein
VAASSGGTLADPIFALRSIGLCASRWRGDACRRFDALQTMIEHEIRTYQQWLDHPDVILECLDATSELSFAGKPMAS